MSSRTLTDEQRRDIVLCKPDYSSTHSFRNLKNGCLSINSLVFRLKCVNLLDVRNKGYNFAC